MAVSLYFWSGSVWAGIAGLSFVGAVGLSTWAMVEEADAVWRLRVLGLDQRLAKLDVELVSRLHTVSTALVSLSDMAEFLGEQSFPHFAEAVKGFKDAQRV
jgi:hypothetical protein